MWREKGRMWDEIGEYTLCSPPVPSDKSTFLNAGRMRAADQYFEHTDLPTRAEYEAWPLWKQDQLADQEWERRENGVWFYNYGTPTYINGRHYFYLNYHRYGVSKPDFREAGRRFYWWWEHVMQAINCTGGYLHTRRRDGKTSRFASIGIEGATRIKFFRFPIQSKNEDSAETVYTKEILPTIAALKECPWFMPEMAGSSRPKREIIFDTPVRQGRGAGSTPDRVKGLGSRIWWAESTENAVDGDGATYHLNDEVAKKQRFNSYARMSVVSKQFEPDGIVVGKGANTSTSDEDDDDAVGMGAMFWNNSDQTKIGPNGQNPDDPMARTASGLFHHFVPAPEGMLCDRYGRDTDAGLQYFLKRREAVAHDPILLLREMRANPFTIAEALLPSIKTDCLFNQGHIGDCQRAIAEYDAERPASQSLVRRYRLYGEPGNIRATEDPTGRFYMSWLPPADWLNQVQQVGYVQTAKGEVARYKPKSDKFGVGADPFDNVRTLKEGSRGACHGFYGWDVKMEDIRGQYGYWPSYSFFVEYAERPDDPDTYYEDVRMLCLWLGCKLFCEIQKVNLEKHFRVMGCGDFLARQPVATMSEAVKQAVKDPNNERTGGASSLPMIEQYTKAKITYYQKFVGGPTSKDSVGNPHGEGFNDDGVPYDFRRMPFQRTMSQDIGFNPADPAIRKKSDLSVSSGFTLIHMTGFTMKPRTTSSKGGLSLQGIRGMTGSMYR